MYTHHHSMQRHQSQQGPRRTKWDALSTACRLRGITITRSFRSVTLTTPDGMITSNARSVAEALDNYHNDVAFCELPIVNTNDDEQEE